MWRAIAIPVFILASLSASATRSTQSLNSRPIIGLLTQTTGPTTRRHGDMYVSSNYVKYIEMAGARVVPILVRQPFLYYRDIFDSVNGVLFPGGGVDIVTSDYAKAAKVFFELAMEANSNGDYFPIWGTCLGFELLTALVTGEDLMSNYSASDYPIPLHFEKGFRKSRLFGNLSHEIYKYLSTMNVTENFHKNGLSPETYKNNSALSSFFKVLSTNLDRNGKAFISTFEANDYPIFGVQWHPEKPNFMWDLKDDIVHDEAAIKVAQYMANFFISEARKSFHHFKSLTTEINSLINNYHPVFSKDAVFGENYYFNFTTQEPDRF